MDRPGPDECGITYNRDAGEGPGPITQKMGAHKEMKDIMDMSSEEYSEYVKKSRAQKDDLVDANSERGKKINAQFDNDPKLKAHKDSLRPKPSIMDRFNGVRDTYSKFRDDRLKSKEKRLAFKERELGLREREARLQRRSSSSSGMGGILGGVGSSLENAFGQGPSRQGGRDMGPMIPNPLSDHPYGGPASVKKHKASKKGNGKSGGRNIHIHIDK
jgi:hypothetical protein